MWIRRLFTSVALILLNFLAFSIIFGAHVAASTGINQDLSFEGKIVNGSSINIPDGTYNMEFKLYDASTGCTPTTGSGCHLSWTEDWLVGSSEGGITFSSGTFEVNLGATCPFSGGSCESYTNTAINWNTYPLYLSLQIGNTSTCTISTNFTSNCGGDTEMKPYILLTSTPYSENSGELGGLTSAGFVQNQNSSPQSTTNFDISGTGQAAAFDAASASTLNLGTTTANALQIGSSTNSTSGVTISTAQNFTLNGVAGSVYAIGAATTTGSITIGGSSQTGAFTLQDNTALTLNTPNAQFSALSAGTRTINIAAQGTNVAGTNLTIQAGAAGAGASAFTGGALNLYGGNAGGTGNANGANVVLQGGNGTGSGVQGLVTSAATLFNSVSYSNGSSGNITQADIDNYSTISATATNPSLTFTVTSPTITTAGRIIYIANVGGTNAFTLAAAGLSSVTVNTGSTVTLLWNGSAWTNASTVPAGGGTTLQTSYAASGNGATAPQITLTSSNNTLNIQDANPTIGANILDVRATASSGLGTVLVGVGNSGQVTTENTSNNIATINGTNLAASTVCTGSLWTNTGTSTSPWTQTSGGATTLTCSLPASVSNGATYEVVYTIAGSPTSGQSAYVTLGGKTGPLIYGTSANETDLITTTATTGISFTVASSTWQGSIGSIAVYLVTNLANPDLVINYSNGTAGINISAGGSGLFSTFVGLGSGLDSTTGQYDTAVGYQSLQNNTTGSGNNAFGYQALQNNTTGYNNNAFGGQALASNTTGSINTAQGQSALYANTTGTANTAVGQEALSSNTSGSYNTSLGEATLGSNTVGSGNTALGQDALGTNSTGSGNSAIGLDALQLNSSGGSNVSIGQQALQNSTTSNNTAVGYEASQSDTSGANNTAIGYYASYQDPTVGAFSTENNLSNTTTLGYGSEVQESNALILGGQGANAVNVGIGTTSPDNLFSIAPVAYSTGTATIANPYTTITGSGTTWTTAMIGDDFIFPDGTKYLISAESGGNSLTVAIDAGYTAVAETGLAYRIQEPNLQVATNGDVGIGTSSPTANLQVTTQTNSNTAVEVTTATGTPIFVVGTASINSSGGQVNYLANPGFEVGLNGWSQVSPGTISRNTNLQFVYHGISSLNLLTTATGGGATTNYFTSTPPPGTYTLSFYAYPQSSMNANTFTLTENDGANINCTPAAATLSTSGFTQVYCTFTSAASNITSITIAQNTGGTGRTIYIDSVQFSSGGLLPYDIGSIQLRGVVDAPATFQSFSNSQTAFQIQNAAGTSNLFVADTLDGQLNIGGNIALTQATTAITTVSAGTINLGSNAIAETINIGDTTTANTGNTQTITLGDLTAAGTATVTIGAFTNATAGNTTLEAFGTLQMQTAASGTINIGALSLSNSINLGTGTGSTQYRSEV